MNRLIDLVRKVAARLRSVRLAYTPTRFGRVPEHELRNFLSKIYGVPVVNLDEFDIPNEVGELVPEELARRLRCIPVNRAGNSVVVAVADPTDAATIRELRSAVPCNVEIVVASEAGILRALDRCHGKVARREAPR